MDKNVIASEYALNLWRNWSQFWL